MIFNANDSYLFYEDNYGIINDYYQNIVELLKQIIINNPDISINITLCENNHIFNNNNKTIRIYINWEHTLVKYGGRSVNSVVFGKILTDDNENYLVRIDNYDNLMASDIIIDYSMPNIHNVFTCDLFKEFSKKHIYLYSSVYNSYFSPSNRDITALTTFININEPRRKILLERIMEKNIEHINVNDCFQKDALEKLYKNTKILINIHQTDHHHTFEELRVLPALQCGVIVISETSPLSNLIPFNDCIIWSSYENILDKVIEVINNYDYFYETVFLNKKINFNEYNNINYNALSDKINEVLRD